MKRWIAASGVLVGGALVLAKTWSQAGVHLSEVFRHDTFQLIGVTV